MNLTSAQWDVYMSGALSALSGEDYSYVTTQIYERVANVCQEIGLRCYLPHKSQTTPNKGMPHGKVWEIDYKRVVNCSAVIAYIGMPALGVGAEIEMAQTAHVPVILLFETAKQEELSRLILGNPAVKYTIPFDRPKDIEEQLRNALVFIFSEKNLDSVAYSENWSFRKREELHKQLLELEQPTREGTKYRNFPKKPFSLEYWSKLGQEAK
jgi:hypothetical protein